MRFSPLWAFFVWMNYMLLLNENISWFRILKWQNGCLSTSEIMISLFHGMYCCSLKVFSHFYFPLFFRWSFSSGLSWWLSGKESSHQCRRCRFNAQVRKIEDPLEKEMAIHSSILAWEISWTEEPGGLQSLGSQKSQTWLSN